MANSKNIEKLVEFMRTHLIDSPNQGFNMDTWYSKNALDHAGHNCGAVACIAGWAASDAFLEYAGITRPDVDRPGIKSIAACVLGIAPRRAYDLFIMESALFSYHATSLGENGYEQAAFKVVAPLVTLEEAIITLNNLALHNTISWDHVVDRMLEAGEIELYS